MNATQRFIPTRRKKAIRRIALCIALYALVFAVSPLRLLPSGALRDLEGQRLTGRTHITDYRAAPLNAGVLTLVTLSESENAVIYALHRFHPLLGWYAVSGSEADCSLPDRPVHCAYLYLSNMSSSRRGEDSACVYFGRVADARVARIEIFADFGADEPEPEQRLLLAQDFSLEPDPRGGAQTFCLELPHEASYVTDASGARRWFRPCIACYDAAGALLYSAEVDQGWSTFLG